MFNINNRITHATYLWHNLRKVVIVLVNNDNRKHSEIEKLKCSLRVIVLLKMNLLAEFNDFRLDEIDKD